jgi:hypothetical protein
MESDETPSWYSGGPYLLVGLPRVFDEFIPLNASSLTLEWESMLDPVRHLRWSTKYFLDRLTWDVGERFIAPSFTTVGWLREAARDEGITTAFAEATGDVVFGSGRDPVELRKFVGRDQSDEHTRVLLNRAAPVLLGLAVTSAVLAGLGRASTEIQRRLPDNFWPNVDAQRVEDDLRRLEREESLAEQRDG